jgi:hypothetical protein
LKEAPKITSGDLLELLRVKHAADVFVPACKNGPTQTTRRSDLLILDAWAMPRSWSKWTTIGYEIKVSRSDFLRDKKWTRYLDLCHELYFVAPEGVVKEEELEKDVGLLVASKTGTRLWLKKRATRREIEPPILLLTYILMCRTALREEWTAERDRTEEWRAWLARKREKQEIGYGVSKRLREIEAEMRTAIASAKSQMERDAGLIDALRKLGLDPDKTSEWNLEKQLGLRDRIRRDVAYHVREIAKTVGIELGPEGES